MFADKKLMEILMSVWLRSIKNLIALRRLKGEQNTLWNLRSQVSFKYLESDTLKKQLEEKTLNYLFHGNQSFELGHLY